MTAPTTDRCPRTDSYHRFVAPVVLRADDHFTNAEARCVDCDWAFLIATKTQARELVSLHNQGTKQVACPHGFVTSLCPTCDAEPGEADHHAPACGDHGRMTDDVSRVTCPECLAIEDHTRTDDWAEL